ncbi:MAG: CoA transferase, partial [Candidatus Eremiobacteraeota bacterium]|nr:CoA transferase [Candidatus Eremiobacteraeota bacterium]
RSLLGGAAPNYRCYECADGRYVAVAALEPKFFAILRERLGLDAQPDADWGRDSRALAAIFAQKTRDEWTALLEGTDACVAPVLTLGEAPAHPHMRARNVYCETGGVVQPAPAPRFSRTPGAVRHPVRGGGGRAALGQWGVELCEDRA